MSKFNLNNKSDSITLFLLVLLVALLGTYVSVVLIQVALLSLWGVEQTKLQIFVAMLIIKALTWN